MRYLRDNTTRGVDPNKTVTYDDRYSDPCQKTLTPVNWSPYGDYNIGFYEVDHGTWQAAYNNATYEAYQPWMYEKFRKMGKSAAQLRGEFKYDMHGARR